MAGNVTGAQQVTSDYTAQVPTAPSDISQCSQKTSIGTFALLKVPILALSQLSVYQLRIAALAVQMLLFVVCLLSVVNKLKNAC